ncbi:MAG: hypothetical protein F4Y03_06015 [Alphaproteobacteria bacterium]|nr:hypothetical protein [Alphaproteobacteria bacterium]
MVRAHRPTFAETRLTPEKRLEIAEAIAARFQPDGSWQQHEWCSRTNDSWGYMAAVELPQWKDQEANCFCLGSAIRIETQRAIPEIVDILSAGGCDEAMALIYARTAGIYVSIPSEPGPHGDPALDAIIDWNDAHGRTIDHVRRLAADVVTHCKAALPIDLTGRRIFTSDLSQGGLIIETNRGVELKIKWDNEDEPVWWDIDEFEDDQALFLQISADTLVRLDRRSIFPSPSSP